MLKGILAASIFAAAVSFSVAAYAQTEPAASDCAAKATEKKLHGAALNSFMKKCERDAASSSCEAAAADKKLHGAAKTSFTKKCVKDATRKPTAQQLLGFAARGVVLEDEPPVLPDHPYTAGCQKAALPVGYRRRF